MDKGTHNIIKRIRITNETTFLLEDTLNFMNGKSRHIFYVPILSWGFHWEPPGVITVSIKPYIVLFMKKPSQSSEYPFPFSFVCPCYLYRRILYA